MPEDFTEQRLDARVRQRPCVDLGETPEDLPLPARVEQRQALALLELAHPRRKPSARVQQSEQPLIETVNLFA